jgi:hypothetical protein
MLGAPNISACVAENSYWHYLVAATHAWEIVKCAIHAKLHAKHFPRKFIANRYGI